MLAEPFKAFTFSVTGAAVLPAWQFWLRPQRAPSIVADALSALPEYGVPKRARVSGESQLCGFLDDGGQYCCRADSPPKPHRPQRSTAGLKRTRRVRRAMIGAAFILTDPIFQGLAISLVFGLASSTALTLLVIPAIYVWLRDDETPAKTAA